MGVAVAVAAAALVAVLLRALRRHAGRIARLEMEKRALSEQLERMKLLERRESVCAPLDALWLCWVRCLPPEDEALHEALQAAEAAKRLFAAELEPDLDEVARLLATLCRHRKLQREAVLAGRHAERVALLDEESAIDRTLKPKLGALRTLLAEATRPVASFNPGIHNGNA
ncbi:MAG TPA: hypothetical protein VH331_04740 [Allosphingosinicella sp.]|nr:hypothetical protein [Allosphingosinicella sp.]